ncbi:MAG: VOC family protein [Chitinophagaceae bacterium]
MAINPQTPGIHHIALRCTNMETTKRFYQNTLGFTLALDTPDIIGFMAGSFILAFKQANPGVLSDSVFNPFNIGLDHIALACENEEELQRVAAALSDAGVDNTGVKLDETLKKQYVAFKDPDRIQWEFYMA